MRPPFALPLALGTVLLLATFPMAQEPRSPSRPGAALPALPHSSPTRILASDNRTPAGTLRDGVLSLALEAREGTWHPDADDGPGMPALAFGERGGPLQIPGPMVRVPAGTEVRISVGNGLAGDTLRVYGLHARAREAGAGSEPLMVPAGATREARFRLSAPGTYFYWGSTSREPLSRRHRHDSQLSGAIVVDDPAAPSPRDRIFVIGEWADSLDEEGAPVEGRLLVPVINGKSWPHTERFRHTVGDSVRWRWINASLAFHPLHLHGFYFRVDGRGDIHRDTAIAHALRPRVVTERVPAGATMTMTWVPEREGNWLFHCHVPRHVEPHLPLDRSAAGPRAHAAHADNHALHGMGGLVLGIHVAHDGGRRVAALAPRRHLRLIAGVGDGGTAGDPVYGFALARAGEEASLSGDAISPVLMLTRGEPTSITVVNRLPETTAVHWHGIELESYFDGVAGFGGTPGRVTPPIAPGDSFAALMTPPRTGTFIYHTHIDEMRQEPAGLSGVLIVAEPGERFDPAVDHPVIITTPRARADRPTRVALNGSLAPPAQEWSAGRRHRIRLVNMSLRPPPGFSVSLVHGDSVARWRPVAKDAAPLPEPLTAPRRAVAQVAIGETYDFEVTPGLPGDYALEVRSIRYPDRLLGRIAIRVR